MIISGNNGSKWGEGFLPTNFATSAVPPWAVIWTLLLISLDRVLAGSLPNPRVT